MSRTPVPAPSLLRRDRGRSGRSIRGEASGGLLKLVIGLVIVAVPVVDTVSVVIVRVNGSDHANEEARIGADSLQGSHDLQTAFDAAVRQAALSSDTIDPNSFVGNPDGSVDLEATHTATTILAGRISFLKHYTVVVSKGHARPFA